MTWTETKACRGCDSADLETVLDLGDLPLVNQYNPIGSSLPTPCFPHQIRFCQRCGMAQQSGALSREEVFPVGYPYRSSTTRSLRDNFAQLYEETQRVAQLGPRDLVVDIGGNDGNLLSHFAAHKTLNVTPEDMGQLGVNLGIDHHQAYWSAATARDVANGHGGARLITATNVFAHVSDPHDFLDGVDELLAPGGMFVSESHYLPDLLRGVQFEACYLEHDRLLSLQSIRHQLAAHDFTVIGARHIPTHGGSIRVYATRKGEERDCPLDPARRIYEDGVTLYDFEEFRGKVVKHRRDLLRLVGEIRGLGMRIVGIGAPSRASTLVSYCGLNADDLECVYEVAGSHKLGRWMPGTRIPIVEEPIHWGDAAWGEPDGQPEFALLLSHHVGHEMVKAWRAKGFKGKFIWPLPTVRAE